VLIAQVWSYCLPTKVVGSLLHLLHRLLVGLPEVLVQVRLYILAGQYANCTHSSYAPDRSARYTLYDTTDMVCRHIVSASSSDRKLMNPPIIISSPPCTTRGTAPSLTQSLLRRPPPFPTGRTPHRLARERYIQRRRLRNITAVLRLESTF
jgi:hypothetical protein